MVNPGLAGAIRRLILTRNDSGHKTDWEVGNWEQPDTPVDGRRQNNKPADAKFKTVLVSSQPSSPLRRLSPTQ